MQKIIKTLLLTICLLSSISLFSKEQKFAIQTDVISKLMIDDQEKQKKYSIPVFLQSSGGYLVACKDASKAYLYTTGEKISVKVLWINSERRSQWIEIFFSEAISGVAEKGKDATLHNSRKLMVFDQNVITGVAHLNHLKISWTSQEPIESISLLDANDENI